MSREQSDLEKQNNVGFCVLSNLETLLILGLQFELNHFSEDM